MTPLSRRGLMAAFALLAALSWGGAASAQVPRLVNPNTASESDLAALPSMNPARAKEMVAKRPFKTAVELNKFLVDQKLSEDQIKAFYARAFVPVDLNAGTREEILLIPGAGPRMVREFNEYRPWKTWSQFDKEIGKYVGQQETDRLKQYVFIPGVN